MLKLVINFFSKSSLDIFSKVVSLISLPIIIRYLGAKEYGEFIFVSMISTYFGFFNEFGYSLNAINKISKNTEQLESIIGEVISVKLFTAFISFSLVLISIVFISNDLYKFLLLFSIGYFISAWKFDYYYIGIKKLYYYSFSEAIGQTVFLISLLFIFKFYANIYTLIIITLLGQIVTSLCLIIPILKNKLLKIIFNFPKIFNNIKESYKIGISQKLEFITSSSTIIMIGYLINKEFVAYYTIPFKVFSLLIIVIGSFSYTIIPFLFKSYSTNGELNISKLNLIFYSFLFFGIILGVFIIVFSEKIIFFMFNEFYSISINTLKGFGFSLMLWSLIMFTGLFFIAINKYGFYLFSTIIASISSVISPLIIINLIGYDYIYLIHPFITVSTIFINYLLLFLSLKELNIPFSNLTSIKLLFKTISSLKK